jgi:GT2 family glycosyltransferase
MCDRNPRRATPKKLTDHVETYIRDRRPGRARPISILQFPAHTMNGRSDDHASPAVSVVVPCLDAGATLDRCLTSLVGQETDTSFEVVVVDNGSTDDSVAIARRAAAESPHRLRLLTESRPGAARARNLGLRESGGGVVLFTDADCIAEPGWLTALARALDDPRVLIAGGEIVGDPAQSGLVARYARSIGLLSQDHTLGHPRAPFFQTANLGVRREDALAVSGFDPELALAGEDADFCWRLAASHAGRELRLVRAARVRHVHRTTAAGLFRQFRGYGHGDVALARRHGRATAAEAAKLTADLLRALGLPLFVLVGAGRAALTGDVLPVAAPWLRVLQATGRRLGQLEALWRDSRPAPRTCA